MSPPVPANEDQRLTVLYSIGVLYTEHEPVFDAICRRAAEHFGAPMAAITLVDREGQWFKAECGLGIDGTPRDVAFCAYAILSDQVMVVPDARVDSRFAENPLVTGHPNIVFYAGAPLVYGENIRLGSICIIDTEPRQFTLDDEDMLTDFADEVAGELWVLASKNARVA
ncbi:GAF domain-containing protein [Chthonobacter albigriseus]|uniref:GAF domain-containing protein n=1 Tax=Chthonobacter albigriseus TaxID=1683161 RepID=UPI0015EE6AE2|nr:GAF domain-containing protein [Chthonobacter albigriseus]